jgi:cytoskeleton protein RodZ
MTEHLPNEDAFHTNLSVGEILRRSRLTYNITFEQAERDLRIKAEHLEALEHNSIDRLPGRVYLFGFVRTYSEYLGLDGEKMIKLLKKQAGRKVEVAKPVLSMPREDEDEEKAPAWPIVVASGVTLLLTLVIVSWVTTPDNPMEIPPVPKELSDQMRAPQKPAEETTVAVAATAGEAAESANAEATPAVAAPHPLVLKALDSTWLEIRSPDRKVVFSRVLNQGEEYWIPEDQVDLNMTLGNAGGLQLVVDGTPLPLLGTKGQVKRNVSLNLEKLRAKTVKSR